MAVILRYQDDGDKGFKSKSEQLKHAADRALIFDNESEAVEYCRKMDVCPPETRINPRISFKWYPGEIIISDGGNIF